MKMLWATQGAEGMVLGESLGLSRHPRRNQEQSVWEPLRGESQNPKEER